MADAGHDELLRRLAARDEAAFATLFDLFGGVLFRIAQGLLGCREEAEDAVQDVFVGLIQGSARLGAVKDLKAYLFAALRHAAAKRRGRLLGLPRQEGVEVADVAAPASPRGESERGVRLERALAALPVEQREAVVLKVDGELTFAELAAVLGVGENTAASRYRYALNKLRAALSEETHGSA